MRELPIGVFDSGIGGLTVVRELMRALPQEHITYLGDTARLPYGTKSPRTVRLYALKNVEFLINRGIKALVVACNTASALALDLLQKGLSIPVIGVIHPGARAAVAQTRTNRIGVIGTVATIRSTSYERSICMLRADMTVYSYPAPLLVPLIEEGWIDTEVTCLTLKHYLEPLVKKDIDTIVLGCTHYPVLKGTIQRVLEEMGQTHINLVDSAEAVASELKDLFEQRSLTHHAESEDEERLHLFVTDNPERFQQVGSIFFNRELPMPTVVEI